MGQVIQEREKKILFSISFVSYISYLSPFRLKIIPFLSLYHFHLEQLRIEYGSRDCQLHNQIILWPFTLASTYLQWFWFLSKDYNIKGVYKRMSNFEIHTLTQSIFNLQISFKYQWNCLENTVSMMSINYFYGD